jgi:F-type H+-transporting ATPase subunit a
MAMKIMVSAPAILAEFNPLMPVTAKPLYIFDVAGHTVIISNHMFMMAVVTVLLAVSLPLLVRSRGLVPRGWHNAIEAICLYIRNEVVQPLLRERTDRFIPYLWTIFFFILTMNLMSMIPTEAIIRLVTGKKNHFGGPMTANIWVTAAMAIISFFVIHVAGIKRQGFFHYFAHLAPKVPLLLLPLIYFLELVTMFMRPFTLAIRLFANMVAGHVILATFIGLILMFKNYYVAAASVSGAAMMSVLELLVAFLQAFIFMFLTAVYISLAVEPEH